MHLTRFKAGDVGAFVGESTNAVRGVLEGQQLQPLVHETLVDSQQAQLAGEVSEAPGQGIVTAIHRAGVDEGRGSVELLPLEAAGAAHGARLHEGHADVRAQHPRVIGGELKQMSPEMPQNVPCFYFCCCKRVWDG